MTRKHLPDHDLELVEALGKNLKRLRDEARLTQAELAQKAGVTVETVARLERVVRDRSSANQNPSLNTLSRLSNALDCDVATLLGQPSTGKIRTAQGRLRKDLAQRLRGEADRIERGL